MPPANRPLVIEAGPEAIGEAARRLRAGELAALPTETVYGLAARADSADAVARIYRAKGRPSFNPLIVHVEDVAMADRYAQVDARARELAARFWPGALTMVLPLRADAALADAVTAGLPTVALRCPAHPVMRAVLVAAGLPLAAPSANRSGAISPSTAAHVVASLGEAAGMVVDGGPCRAGIESTIVALRPGGGWEVLRPGPVTSAELADALGAPIAAERQAGAPIEAPGQLASHYAPGKPLLLGVGEAPDDAFHIGFGAVSGHASLSEGGDLAEAASRLYALLHLADASEFARIAVAPIPETGIGQAINDRLRRAAA